MVDLADRAGDLAAKRVMGLAQPLEILAAFRRIAAAGRAAGEGRLDSRERPFDPPGGVEGAGIGHFAARIASPAQAAKRYG